MKKVVLGLILLICLAFLASNLTYTRNTTTLTTHDPIYIKGDKDFTEGNGVIKGSGTREDPYVIDGWGIDTGNSKYGIHIENTTKYLIIKNCKVSGQEGTVGIYLKNIVNGSVRGCDISNNNGGIVTRQGKAIEISGNKIESNYYGIMAEETFYLNISQNRLASNAFGLLFSRMSAAEVTGNTIELNSWNGIYVDASSALNRFFHNNFLGNKIAHAWDQGLNNWDSGSEGNYWDNYKGKDRDGDGIGDTPYRILGRGSSENYDYHPLMKPWERGG